MQPGQSFFWPRNLDKHRWIIVSDPKKDPERVVLMNFTSMNSSRRDTTCIVTKREFSSFDHDSCISYADAKVLTLVGLEAMRAQSLLSLSKMASPEVLRRVQQGAAVSKDLRGDIKAILRGQGLIS